MIAIADSVTDGTWDKLIFPFANPEVPNSINWPGARHRLGANVLFTDGHVDPRLQAALLRADENERRRWNNDNLPHREWWPIE